MSHVNSRSGFKISSLSLPEDAFSYDDDQTELALALAIENAIKAVVERTFPGQQLTADIHLSFVPKKPIHNVL